MSNSGIFIIKKKCETKLAKKLSMKFEDHKDVYKL